MDPNYYKYYIGNPTLMLYYKKNFSFNVSGCSYNYELMDSSFNPLVSSII